MYFPNEATAERAAEHWYAKAEQVMAGRGSSKFKAETANRYLQKAVDCYTKRLEWLEERASEYYPNY